MDIEKEPTLLYTYKYNVYILTYIIWYNTATSHCRWSQKSRRYVITRITTIITRITAIITGIKYYLIIT